MKNVFSDHNPIWVDVGLQPEKKNQKRKLMLLIYLEQQKNTPLQNADPLFLTICSNDPNNERLI